jgi:hypothetical protein
MDDDEDTAQLDSILECIRAPRYADFTQLSDLYREDGFFGQGFFQMI